MEMLQSVKYALERRGFKAYVADTSAQATELVKDIVGTGKSVGFGGSVTVGSLGIADALEKAGNTLYTHWRDGASAKYKAATADYYICSANALTKDGVPVLTDGSGNRVSALSFGPSNAILVVGKNKIVPDYSAAVARIKSGVCAGANAARLGISVPCARGEGCTDCADPGRICGVTAFFERPSKGLQNTYVILVNEELGY